MPSLPCPRTHHLSTLALVATVLLGCDSAADGTSTSSSGTGGAGGGPPLCTADVSTPDLLAENETASYSPAFAVALDDEGLVAVTVAKDGALRVRRWAADGTERASFDVDSGVTLPGGDGRLSALSVTYASERYFVAWETADGVIHARVLGSDGTGGASAVVSPKTRKLGGSNVTVEAFAPVVRLRGDAVILTWTELAPGNEVFYPMAIFGLDGARLDQGNAYIHKFELGDNFTFGDAELRGSTLTVLGGVQGSGSIANIVTAVATADLADPRTWKLTQIPIDQPSGDVRRTSQSITRSQGLPVLVQRATLDEANAPRKRIEVVRLDDAAHATSIQVHPIGDDRPFFVGLQALPPQSDTDPVRFVWADSGDIGGYDPVLHDATFATDASGPTVLDTPLALSGAVDGFLDSLGAPKLAARSAPGGVRHGFQWTAGGFTGAPRVEHLGSVFVCADAR